MTDPIVTVMTVLSGLSSSRNAEAALLYQLFPGCQLEMLFFALWRVKHVLEFTCSTQLVPF